MAIHDYNNSQHFQERNACLLVDVYCYECKKLMALSNAKQYDGRYYCHHCIKHYVQELNIYQEVIND